MTETRTDPLQDRIDALHARMAEHSLGGHWQTRQRPSVLEPFVWSWESIYTCLMESGEVIKIGHIDEAAKRRTVNLVNPGLKDFKATSRTLQMSVQLVKPDEMAECHRHTAAALRFVVEGDGTAYTNVEGERMSMEPGDLVLTPHWTFHDHHNTGDKPVVWLDVLDVHLTNALDANVHDNYVASPEQANYFGNASQPILFADGHSRHLLGPVRPKSVQAGDRALPYVYKWSETLKALEWAAEADQDDPFDGILLDYANPVTGGATMPTIGCRVQMLRPGQSTQPHHHTSSTIYHVVQGAGAVSVGSEKGKGERFSWGTKDCFFVPSMKWHSLSNESKTEPAILFSVSDRPVLEKLGLYMETS